MDGSFQALKKVVKAVMPYGLVEWRNETRARRFRECTEAARAGFHAERRERIAEAMGSAPRVPAAVSGVDVEQVAAFLRGRGIPEQHVREGSIPSSSLRFLKERVFDTLEPGRPPCALHVGNFVGVSLVYLGAAMAAVHPDSLVVSVDPNLTHRGIANPQAHVSALLTACGLQRNTLVIAGYSGGKSVSNDGTTFGDYDPVVEFSRECACENSVANLARLCRGAFDIAMLDGNHEAGYLLKELGTVRPLLREGARLILDDVDEAWAELKQVFLDLPKLGWTPIATDGRVGVAGVSAQEGVSGPVRAL